MAGSGGGRRGINNLWVLAGGYLIYLGVSLLYGACRGTASGGVLSFAFGAGFTAVGGALLLREWRNAGPRRDAPEEEPPAPDGGEEGEA